LEAYPFVEESKDNLFTCNFASLQRFELCHTRARAHTHSHWFASC